MSTSSVPNASAATSHDRERMRAVQKVLWITLALNVAVAAAKLAYGMWAGAIAIRADGVHSFTDGFGNIIALISIAVASRPADDGHPYGHRKIEVAVSAFAGMVLIISAAELLREAAQRLWTGTREVARLDTAAFVVLGVTLVINVFVTVYEARAGKKWNSPMLQTDAMHTRSDVFVSLGVIAASFFAWIGHPDFDVAAGIAVAAIIGVTGVRLVLRNAGYLVDAARVPPAHIEDATRAVAGVRRVRDVRSRGAPGAVAVDLSIEVDPGLTVRAGHDIAHAVSAAVRAALPEVVDVVVHVEPAADPT